MVEIASHYKFGKLVRQTANGIDIPLVEDLLPDIVIEENVISFEEYEKRWGNLKK